MLCLKHAPALQQPGEACRDGHAGHPEVYVAVLPVDLQGNTGCMHRAASDETDALSWVPWDRNQGRAVSQQLDLQGKRVDTGPGKTAPG